MYFPVLLTNLYFTQFLHIDRKSIKQVCHTAMSVVHYMSQQVVFEAFVKCNCVYMIESGSLAYILAHRSSFNTAKCLDDIEAESVVTGT